MNWDQPMCRPCWDKRFPGRHPYVFEPQYRQAEKCCDCGETTQSGIYVRMDPKEVNYPAKDDES